MQAGRVNKQAACRLQHRSFFLQEIMYSKLLYAVNLI